jgi:hypothetical protein
MAAVADEAGNQRSTATRCVICGMTLNETIAVAEICAVGNRTSNNVTQGSRSHPEDIVSPCDSEQARQQGLPGIAIEVAVAPLPTAAEIGAPPGLGEVLAQHASIDLDSAARLFRFTPGL